jgi:hypothetical protein
MGMPLTLTYQAYTTLLTMKGFRTVAKQLRCRAKDVRLCASQDGPETPNGEYCTPLPVMQ